MSLKLWYASFRTKSEFKGSVFLWAGTEEDFLRGLEHLALIPPGCSALVFPLSKEDSRLVNRRSIGRLLDRQQAEEATLHSHARKHV